MRPETVSQVLAAVRPNGLSIWIMAGMRSRGAQIIIPGVEHEDGDYAELVDAKGQPIEIVPRAHSTQPPIAPSKWWCRCCRKDGSIVWLMPFAVWQVFRDRAAEASMMGRSADRSRKQ